MGPLQLFKVASQHNQWLAVRQSTIAGNIANVNTPGFKALDTEPFEIALESTRLAMASPRSGHMTFAAAGVPVREVRQEEAWEVMHSGNTVSLEQELIKAGDINRSFSLNTSVIKAFHRMLLASSKG